MKVARFTPVMIAGPVGSLESMVLTNTNNQPASGIALIAHPHSLQGGSNHNKIVHTLAKQLAKQGYIAYCPNFRGVGYSHGHYDAGIGEVDDMVAVLNSARQQHGHLPLVLAGFSFGCFVQAQLYQRLGDEQVQHMIFVGPACGKFALPNITNNALIIHGEEDEVIALTDVLAWARPQQLAVVVVPGVGHFFHGKLALLSAIINRWRPYVSCS